MKFDEKKTLPIILVSLGIPAVLFLYYKITWETVGAFVTAIDHCPRLFCDFVNHYFPMGQTLFTTHTPVPGYFYTSFFALFLSLFSFFQLEGAVLLWGVFQGTVTFLLVSVPAVYFYKRWKPQYFLYLFLFFSSFPVLHNLKWGQVSIALTLCVIGAFFLYRREWKFLAAVLLAISFAVKFYTGVFLIYFLLKRDLRFVVVFLVSVFIFMIVMPSFFIGIGDNIGFYGSVNRAVDSSRAWISMDVNSQYAANVITRVLPFTGDSTVFRIILVIAGYLVFGINIFIIYKMTKTGSSEEVSWVFFLLFVSLPFILETSWSHYFVYLPFCHVMLVKVVWEEVGSFVWRVVNYVLLVFSILSASIFFFNIIGKWYLFAHSGFLFFSNLAVLILFYSLYLRRRVV